MRNLISETKSLYKLIDFKDVQIFGDAANYTCILFLKIYKNDVFSYIFPKSTDTFTIQSVSNVDTFQEYKLPLPKPDHPWILSENKVSELIRKLSRKGIPLEIISKNIFQSLTTSADGIYFVQVESETRDTAKIRNIKNNLEFAVEKTILRKLLKGKDIRRCSVDWKGSYVVYPYLVKDDKASLITLSEIKDRYPLAYEYFKHYELQLKTREDNKLKDDENWHQYIYRKNLEKFEQKKIVTQVLASKNTFAIDLNGEFYFVGGDNAGGYGIVLNDNNQNMYYFVLALLNSNVLEFYLKNISTPFRGGYFSYGKRFIDKLPLLIPKDSRFDSVSSLSKEQMNISKKMRNFPNTDERDLLEREYDKRCQELNQMIYEIYGLNKLEITLLDDRLCQ
ncbi:type IV site-specific deoxyribonuclease Eco57I related protein [Thermoplasma acidophilum]|uniref:site-specific DNA-methyltransferase (adenine-specific) n=1 Tax=Thermoplasma acidophilum (strain ATCC 25905 / DSM 1728 / JCM 9062 / NBRC 15155 / AMRC-C165) TaxID=273075 RepID=Q9HIK2_THEAC|nr:type IV site-specific deoxyribonuclease Eco57I related protein [Thermoplasma acidophilum]